MRSLAKQMPRQLGLVPGARWLFEGQVIEIDGVESASLVNVRFEATGELRSVPVAALQALPETLKYSQFETIRPDEWSRIMTLAGDIRPLACRERVPGQILVQVATTHGISERHVQRLIAKFKINPRTSALARGRRGRPKGCRLLSPAVEAVVGHVIDKYFLKRESVSRLEVVERARSVCRRCGLPPPSKGAVCRRIEACVSYESDLRRIGPKAAKQRWELRPGRFTVEQPLDWVQMDHTLVDLIVLSDDRREALGRPWLSVAIDLATRVVLGFYLSMDAPSAISVGLCIVHALLPKPEDARDPGFWPMFGKMKVIHVDNGDDLVSAAIRRGCEEHGIAVETRPLGKAHYGGHIERLMGSLMKMVHGLRGTTFSNVKERGDYDSEGKATMTLMELHQWMFQKIARCYHTRTHRGIGVPPLVAWERAWRSEEGQMMLPPLVPRPNDIRLDFLPFEHRRLQRTGVQLWRSRYWSEPLSCVFRPALVVKVHYHPHELGRVWVRTEDDHVIEAYAVAGPAAGQVRQRAMDAEERARIDSYNDAGFAECDRIEQIAASAKRAQDRRDAKKVAKGKGQPQPRTRAKTSRFDDATIDIPLDSSSVQVKRFVQ